MSKRRIDDLEVEESAEKRLKSQLDDILKDLSYKVQQRLVASLDVDEITAICNQSEAWETACNQFPAEFWQQKMQTMYGKDWRKKARQWADDAGAPPGFLDLDNLTLLDLEEIEDFKKKSAAKVFEKNRKMRGMIPPRQWREDYFAMDLPEQPIPVPED